MGIVGDILELLGMPRETFEIIMGIESTGSEKPTYKPGSKIIRFLPNLLHFVLTKSRVSKNIEKFLINEKIKYIECIGKTFDHNYHHAVTVVDDEKHKDKTIIKEIKKCFLVDKDVLRPSHVIVSKKENKNK